jgi:beta-galactosidase
MVGGSNFDNWACSEQGANYDFGAPVGQAGDFREAYYGLKLAANFATSFQSILDDSDNTSDKYQNAADGVKISARTAPAGTIVFLDNQQGSTVQTHIKLDNGQPFPSNGPINIAPNEIVAAVEDYQIFPGLKLNVAATRILELEDAGNTSTMVVYGPAGDQGQLNFDTAGKVAVTSDDQEADATNWTLTDGHADLKFAFPAQRPGVYTITCGGHTLRIIAETSFLAQRSYDVNVDGANYLVCGPDYVGEAEKKDGHLVFHTEQMTNPASPATADWIISNSGSAETLKADPTYNISASSAPRVPAMSPWLVADGSAPARLPFDDAHWLVSHDPMPMGADNSESSYAWYHTTVNSDNDGSYNIDIADAGDWVGLYVDGIYQSSSNVATRFDTAQPRTLAIHVHKGINNIAFLASHYGRSKIHAYVGPIDVQDRKGISGPVDLVFHPDVSQDITQFREKADDNGQGDVLQMTAHGLNTTGADWKDATIGTDVFNGHVGFAWYRAVLPDLPAPGRYIKFSYVDDNAFVYVNGKLVVSSQGYGVPFGANIDAAWNPHGPNDLAVLVQNTNGGGGIFGPVNISGPAFGGKINLIDWKMKGGLDIPGSASAWKPVNAKTSFDGSAKYYQSTFTMPQDTGTGLHPVLRFSPSGLSRGTVWLNGLNLGRYPELTTGVDIWFPESYLHEGKNTITVFDEDGVSPASAKIVEETAATRTDVILVKG